MFHPYVHLSVYLYVRLSLRQSNRPSVYTSVRPRVSLFVCSSVCLIIRLFICRSVCRSVCVSIRLYFYLHWWISLLFNVICEDKFFNPTSYKGSGFRLNTKWRWSFILKGIWDLKETRLVSTSFERNCYYFFLRFFQFWIQWRICQIK